MMHGGIYDQVGGGFARYSVDAVWLVPHFEKMLYDNALLARAYLHGWQVIGEERWHARSAATRSTGRCARCTVPRAASTRRSTPTPRARRAASTSGTRTRLREALTEAGIAAEEVERILGYWGVSPAGNFEGRNILHVPARRRRRAAAAARRGPPRPARPPRAAGPPRPRRQAALLLERADDRGARRRRRGARARRLPRRRGAAAPASSSSRCATTTGRLLRTWKDGEAPPQRLPRGPRLPGRGAAAPVRGDPRGALVRRRPRDRRGDDRALRRRRARRLLHHLARPRGADRAAQGPRRPPDPGRATPRPRWACCASRRSPARRATRSAAVERPAPVRPARPSATPTPSATCCRRSTSTSPPSARSRWSRPANGAAARRRARRARRGRPRRAPPPPRPRRRRGGHASAPSCCATARAVEGEAAAYVCEQLRLQGAGDRARASWSASSADAG